MSYVGDRLPPIMRDELRKSFGLPPWPTVRRVLPDPPDTVAAVVEGVRVSRPLLRSEPTVDYDRLMREPARGRLGSEV